jgi:hypothetical protein
MRFLKSKEEFRRFLIILVLVMAFLFLSYIMLIRVNGQAYLQCSSGDLKGDYVGTWDSEGNFTSNYIELSEINNMHCTINAKFNAPWWFFGGLR